MANLDSRNKRSSSVTFDLIFGHIYPNPDGTLGQADRQHIAYKYPGILAQGVSGGSISFRTLLV